MKRSVSVLVLLSLFCLTGCGLKFTEFSPPDSSFKIKMPGTPVQTTKSSYGANGQIWEVESSGWKFSAGKVEINVPGGNPSASQLQSAIESSMESTLKSVGGSINGRGSVTCSGFTGSQIEYAVKGGALDSRGQKLAAQSAVVRFFIVNNKVFVAECIYKGTITKDSADVKTFMESLAINEKPSGATSSMPGAAPGGPGTSPPGSPRMPDATASTMNPAGMGATGPGGYQMASSANPMGTYSPMGAGTYSPTGATSPMGAGTYSPMGAGTYSPMAAGTYSPMGAGTYTPMGAGTYSPMGANSPMGTFPNPMGANPTASGTYSPTGGTYSPMGAAAGTFPMPAGTTPMPAGTYSPMNPGPGIAGMPPAGMNPTGTYSPTGGAPMPAATFPPMGAAGGAPNATGTYSPPNGTAGATVPGAGPFGMNPGNMGPGGPGQQPAVAAFTGTPVTEETKIAVGDMLQVSANGQWKDVKVLRVAPNGTIQVKTLTKPVVSDYVPRNLLQRPPGADESAVASNDAPRGDAAGLPKSRSSAASKPSTSAPKTEAAKGPGIVSLDGASVEDLLKIIANKNEHRRIPAAEQLRDHSEAGPNADVAKKLIDLLKVDELNLRAAVARALEKWVAPEVHPAVLKNLSGGTTEVRQSMMRILSAEKVDGSADAIANCLADNDDRKVAMEALIAFGEPATAAVVKMLDHKNSKVKLAACEVLKGIGSSDAAAALKKVTETWTGTDRLAARKALQELESKK